MRHMLRPHQRHGTEGAHKRLAFYPAAQRPAGGPRGTEFGKEAQIHRATSQETVRSGIIERQNGLRTAFLNNSREALVDYIKGLIPGDRCKLPCALWPDALQRRAQPVR